MERVSAWVRLPAFARIAPFALLIICVALSSFLPPPHPVAPGDFDSRWIYAIRAIVAGIALGVLWPRFSELGESESLGRSDGLLAVAAGIGVFVVWICLDFGWLVIGYGALEGFDPRRYGTQDLDWPLTVFRFLGLAVVVPIAEELFWRSFLMRWLERQDFLACAPAAVGVRSLAISSVVFALEHSQWLAGLAAGLVYGGLYIRTGKLWAPIVAHAVTNAALGAWILATRDWHYW